jgi:hypothetical protein
MSPWFLQLKLTTLLAPSKNASTYVLTCRQRAQVVSVRVAARLLYSALRNLVGDRLAIPEPIDGGRRNTIKGGIPGSGIGAHTTEKNTLTRDKTIFFRRILLVGK